MIPTPPPIPAKPAPPVRMGSAGDARTVVIPRFPDARLPLLAAVGTSVLLGLVTAGPGPLVPAEGALPATAAWPTRLAVRAGIPFDPATVLAVVAAVGLVSVRVGAGLHARPVLRVLMLGLPVIAGLALALPLSVGWAAGWYGAVIAAAKAGTSLAVMSTLVECVPAQRLLTAMRRLGLPAILADTAGFLLRYIEVAADQAVRMARARSARTFRPQGWREWRPAAGQVGTLLAAGFDRSQRICRAMAARTFGPPGAEATVPDGRPDATASPRSGARDTESPRQPFINR